MAARVLSWSSRLGLPSTHHDRVVGTPGLLSEVSGGPVTPQRGGRLYLPPTAAHPTKKEPRQHRRWRVFFVWVGFRGYPADVGCQVPVSAWYLSAQASGATPQIGGYVWVPGNAEPPPGVGIWN